MTTQSSPDGSESVCKAVDCTKPARSRGYCPTHYQRFRRTGDPGTARRPGRKPDKFTADNRRQFGDWSDRTFARYKRAMEILAALAPEHACDAIAACTRESGSVNVSQLESIANARLEIAAREDQIPGLAALALKEWRAELSNEFDSPIRSPR